MRDFPQLGTIQDPNLRQALSLIWDRLHDLSDDRTGDAAAVGALQTAVTTLTATQDLQAKQLIQSMVATGKITAQAAPPPWVVVGGGASGGSGGGPGGNTDISWDAGQGNAGWASAGPTGHVSPSAPKNLFTVGQIVGGTAKEFSALLEPTVDGATRNANLDQLLRRIIWHLQRAGFTAGRNRNPSGATGIDNFTVMVDGFTRGYDIYPFTNFGPPITSGTFYLQAATTFMLPLQPGETTYLPDGGIPD